MWICAISCTHTLLSLISKSWLWSVPHPVLIKLIFILLRKFLQKGQKVKWISSCFIWLIMILCYLPLNFYWRSEYIYSHRCQAIVKLQWLLTSVSWSISVSLFRTQILNLTLIYMSTFPLKNRVGTTIYNLYIELIDIELPFDITVSSSSGLNAERGLFNQAPLQIPQVENGMDYGVSVEELGNNTKDYKDGLKINRRLRNHCKGLVSPTMTSKKRPPAYCYMIFLLWYCSLTGRSSNRQCNGKADGTPCKKSCRSKHCRQVFWVVKNFKSIDIKNKWLTSSNSIAGF